MLKEKRKKKIEKKSGQEGQNNLCPHFAGHAGMGQPQYPLPQLGQQIITTTSPFSLRFIETRLHGLGKAASSEKEVEHRWDFQTTLIIGSQKPDRTAHPQRSSLGSTMFAPDAVPLNIAPETTQGLNLPINICSQQGCCSEPSSHLF